MLKQAIIYQRNKVYFIHASSRTIDGVWIPWDPKYSLAQTETPSKIGEYVLAALAGSCLDVPHPRDWSMIFNPILELSHAKSWGVFYKSAECIYLELDQEKIRFIPTKKHGARRGFEPEPLKQIVATTSDPYEIGVLVAKIFGEYNRRGE